MVTSVLESQRHPELSRDDSDSLQHTRDFAANAVRDGIASGELRADLDTAMARDFVFGGLEHRVRDLVGRGRRIDPVRLAREFTAMLLEGFGTRPAPSDGGPLDRIEARLARLEGEIRARDR